MYLKRTTWLSQVSVIYSLWIPLNAFSFSQIDDKITFHCSSVMFLSAAVICFDICGLELANICFYYVWMFYHKVLASLTLSPGHLCPVDSLPHAVFQYHHCYPSQWGISPYSSFTDLFGHLAHHYASILTLLYFSSLSKGNMFLVILEFWTTFLTAWHPSLLEVELQDRDRERESKTEANTAHYLGPISSSIYY